MSGPLSNPFMFKSAAGAGDFYSYQITKSARFDGSASYLNKTWGSAPSSTTQVALSIWLKKSFTGNVNPVAIFTAIGNTGSFYFNNDDAIADNLAYYMGGGGINGYTTNIRYRDPSAWFHFVAIINSAASNDYDRLKIYINGELIALNGGEWTQNAGHPNTATPDAGKNGVENYIGRYGSATRYWDGYMADFIQIDGSASISDFGETKNGVWIPKDPSGLTFGNNGFWLKFTNASDFGEDFSGNNNDWTANSMGADHQTGDTPTFNSDSNGGNFCTYNSIIAQGNALDLMALSEGNLHSKSETNDKYSQAIGNMGVNSGKWYTEFYLEAAGYPSWAVGWHYGSQLGRFDGDVEAENANLAYIGYFTGNNVYIKAFGSTATADPQVAWSGWTSAGDAPTTGDVIMCAIDIDAGKVWWGFNGEWGDVGSGTGNPATGANASNTWTVANYPDYKYPFTLSWANPDAEIIMNCGQEGTFAGHVTAGGNADDTGYGNFKYDVPAGFLSLCTGNLPITDAVDPAQTSSNFPQKLFGATIWTGDGNTSRAITGLGFQPDWVWFKARDSAFSNRIYDTSRGISSTGGKRLFSNTTGVEVDQTSGQDISAVGSDGFTLGASSANYTNDTNNDAGHVAWTWRANGGTTSTNSNGDTNSTVQVDPSGHFSIVLGTGDNDNWGNPQTFGHGLSAAPTCIIGKKRADNDDEWQIFFSDYGGATIGGSNAACNSLVLNSSAALYTNQSYKGWGGTMPTSTVFTLDGNNLVQNGDTFVCYCFANCEGYIKSGAYTGNNSADGSFVYTGFKPAFLMIKRLDSSANWVIFDTKRGPHNPTSEHLSPDTSTVEYEGTSYELDILSNGFKLRDTWSTINAAGYYVYLAVAHNPFKYATAR